MAVWVCLCTETQHNHTALKSEWKESPVGKHIIHTIIQICDVHDSVFTQWSNSTR